MVKRLMAAGALTLAAVASAAARDDDRMDIAVLGGLDKITARISSFEAPVGAAVAFGRLTVVVRACHKTPPEEPPERAAFLEVVSRAPGAETGTLIFSGWMFASSPGLSALEHPIYDVWVIDCRNAPEPTSPRAGGEGAQ